MPATRLGEVYPKKSSIILTRKRSAKSTWRVDISARLTGGRREQRQFLTRDKAEEYAERRWTEIQKVGQRAFALTATEREDAARAVDSLAGTGITLFEAAKIALRHHRPHAASITVSELREKFLAAPGRKKGRLITRRPRSHENFSVRTKLR